MSLEIIRPLRQVELGELEKPLGVKTPAVGKIRQSHHALARLMAEGRKGVEIAAITGYSQSRISILKGDPAFAELVQYYSGQVEGKFMDVHERLAALQGDAVQELHSRLDEEPEKVSNQELMEIIKLGAKGQQSGGSVVGDVSFNISFVEPEKPTIEGSVSPAVLDVEPEA